jgi:hypothetical protein
VKLSPPNVCLSLQQVSSPWKTMRPLSSHAESTAMGASSDVASHMLDLPFLTA